jgi:hypothetical protein
MKKLRNPISLAIALSMLGLMPGLDCYQAAATVIQTQGRAVSGAVNPALGAVTGNSIGRVPALQLKNSGLSSISISRQAAPGISAGIAAPQTIGQVQPLGVPAAEIPLIKGANIVGGEAVPAANNQSSAWDALMSFARSSRGSRRMPDYDGDQDRSEEHTSELQSPLHISYAVFCLKKKTSTTGH